MSDTTSTSPIEPEIKHPGIDRDHLLAVLDIIRPSLQADGGDLELLGVTEDGIVQIHLTGACNGCPLSSLTLSAGVERVLKEHVPGIVAVQEL